MERGGRLSESRRLEGIEALRGYAACAIIVMHSTFIQDPVAAPPEWMSLLRGLFWLGVPLFFVVSAFSLFYGYAGKLDNAPAIKTYFVRRFLRIAPLFYFAIAAWSVYCLNVGSPLQSSTSYLLNVSFTFGLFPATYSGIAPASWTIGVEMLFYALVPALSFLIRSWQTAALALVISMFIAKGFAVIPAISELGNAYQLMNFPAHLPFFMCGILAYNLLKIAPKSKLASYALLGAAIILAFVLVQNFAWAFPIPLTTYGWGIVFGAVIVSQAVYPNAIVSNRVTNFLGKISFSLYLLHPLVLLISPIAKFIYSIQLPIWASFLLNSVTSIAIVVPFAWLTYRYIEYPCNEFAKYMTTRLTRNAPIAAASLEAVAPL